MDAMPRMHVTLSGSSQGLFFFDWLIGRLVGRSLDWLADSMLNLADGAETHMAFLEIVGTCLGFVEIPYGYYARACEMQVSSPILPSLPPRRDAPDTTVQPAFDLRHETSGVASYQSSYLPPKVYLDPLGDFGGVQTLDTEIVQSKFDKTSRIKLGAKSELLYAMIRYLL